MTESDLQRQIQDASKGYDSMSKVLVLALAGVAILASSPNTGAAAPITKPDTSMQLASQDVDNKDMAITKNVYCDQNTPKNKLPILTFGSTGPCVRFYQKLLVKKGEMDASAVDGVYGIETAGRTKGVQIKYGLRGTDGTLGTGNGGILTWGLLESSDTLKGMPTVCTDMVRGACASKRENVVYLMKNHKVAKQFYASFGDESSSATRTDEGYTNVPAKYRNDYSEHFKVNLKNIVYINGDGEGFHEGDPNVKSHGCIHLSPSDAKTAYSFLRKGDPVATY